MQDNTKEINPIQSTDRYIILDVLRGIALFGICLANYPEFSLYTFQKDEVIAGMPTANIDQIIKYLQYIFIEGKFYTIFSLLFGIGFSIILSNAQQKGRKGIKIFYRRMAILALIGLMHLLLLWAGDILILYAVLGMLLPFCRNLSSKKLLISSISLLLLPVVIDSCVTFFDWNLATLAISATQYFHAQAGITDDNFPVWLAEHNNYLEILKFNLAGSFIRIQEFIDGNRAFKVLGLFLLGLYIGQSKIYTSLQDNKATLRKGMTYGFIIGLPTSILYAWSAMNSHPFGLVSHSVIYAISVVPLSFAYISTICLWYIKNQQGKIFEMFAAPGRMALTNYIMQSVLGMIIFYGIGFGLGAKIGLVYVELIAVLVFGFQITYSYLWLYYNKFGPLEWGWRILTYGKWLKLAR